MIENVTIALSPLFEIFAGITELFTGKFGMGLAFVVGGLLLIVGAFKTALAIATAYYTMKTVAVGIQSVGIAQTIMESGALGMKSLAELKDATATELGAAADLNAAGANKVREKSEEDLADAQEKQADATENGGRAAGSAALQMLALGAAVLLIGAGVYLAATGMGNFVESFSQLNAEQLIAAGLGIAAFAVGLYFLIPALIGFATVGGLSIKIMLGIAAAVALIGIGIGAAAAGIGYFIQSIGSLSKDVTVSAEGMEKLTQVIKVTSEMDEAQLENAESVFDKVISVMVESNNASVPALTALADAVAPAATGEQGGSNKKIELKLNDRVLGDVIVNIMKEKYDLTPR